MGGSLTNVILLLQAEIGAAQSVATAVSQIPGVVRTHVTSGPYDVIGHVERDDANGSGEVLDAVRQIKGLARLCVCRAVQ